MQSIFATAPPATNTPPPENTAKTDTTNTEEDNDTAKTSESEAASPPSEPIVRMPDGREVPASEYVKTEVQTQVAAESQRINSEWDRIRAAELRSTENGGSTDTETPSSDPPAWKVSIDNDSFQSDNERVLADGLNGLGEAVTKQISELTETVKGLTGEVQTLGTTTTEAENQRQIENIERTKGVTEAELTEVYNEFGGNVKDLNALAEIVASRKDATQASEERTKTADEERRTATSHVSGGGQSQSSDSDTTLKGRGLTGKAIYSGEAIAAKYSAFGPSPA